MRGNDLKLQMSKELGDGDGTNTNPSMDPPEVGRRTVLHPILLSHLTPCWTSQPQQSAVQYKLTSLIRLSVMVTHGATRL